MRSLLVIALIALLVLSGCAGKSAPQQTTGPAETTDPYELPPGVDNILRGRVIGPDQTPLQGALVEVISLQLNQTTDADGAYEFQNLEPHDYLVVVSLEGYRTKTQRAIVEDGRIFELDFALEEKPTITPYMEMTPFRGMISCELAYATNPENVETFDCGSVDPNNKRANDFYIRENAAQVQIEAVWQPTTETSKNLAMTIESVGFGHQDIQFGREHGPSGLKMTISQSLVQKYYTAGGTVRVTMSAAPSVTGEEAAIDVGFALQQNFQIYFSTFYVEPGPPAYSAIPK